MVLLRLFKLLNLYAFCPLPLLYFKENVKIRICKIQFLHLSEGQHRGAADYTVT